MFHCSMFSLMEELTTVVRTCFVRKFLDSMIDAFLIVLPFFKNSNKRASDMTCFIDINLGLRWAEHKWGIRYFVICAKAGWRHRLEVLLLIWKPVLGNIGNQSVFKINTIEKSRRFHQYFDVFLFRIIYFWNTQILAKIWEI